MSDSKPQNDVTRHKPTSSDATKNGYQTVVEGHHYKKGSITSFQRLLDGSIVSYAADPTHVRGPSLPDTSTMIFIQND
jgi:hypothetical protein